MGGVFCHRASSSSRFGSQPFQRLNRHIFLFGSRITFNSSRADRRAFRVAVYVSRPFSTSSHSKERSLVPSTSKTRTLHRDRTNLLSYLCSWATRGMATKLPKLPDVAKLSTSVITVLGGNSNKFTLQGTNTYILGTGKSRILLDTAQGFEAWKTSLSRVLKEENISISKCLLTHWHHDHIGGVSDFQELCPNATIWKAFGNTIDPDNYLTNVDVEVIEDGAKFDDGSGFEIEAVYCPGHTKDHMAFVVTKSTDDSEIGAIFTADNVLGHGTAVFENLATYLKSLDIMKAKLHRKARAYPGHGMVIEDAQAKIEEYKEHRKMREDEAMNVLKFGSPKKPELGKEVAPGKEWGSMDMVKVIYWDVPEHLHEPAERGLLMVLEKLKGEGRIIENNGKWKIGEKAAL